MYKVLVTCPPMLKQIHLFSNNEVSFTVPKVIQTLSFEELKLLIPGHDGWIIGDDAANRELLKFSKDNGLRALVKWGIGIDNIDLNAINEFNLFFTNTPNMFGAEVSDIAVGYVIALARNTFEIDRGVRQGEWPKQTGVSLADKYVAVIGYGDIGKNTVKRLIAADMKVMVYDNLINQKSIPGINFFEWPHKIEDADFIVINCSLNDTSFHMLNSQIFDKLKNGVRIVNVSRGGIINENHLINALKSGKVYSAALDVFEEEPLPLNSYIRQHPRCILGTHNASNTIEAVNRTSQIAIEKMIGLLSSDTNAKKR